MKVSIIGGGGRVGSNAAFALQCAGIVSEIHLLDANESPRWPRARHSILLHVPRASQEIRRHLCRELREMRRQRHAVA